MWLWHERTDGSAGAASFDDTVDGILLNGVEVLADAILIGVGAAGLAVNSVANALLGALRKVVDGLGGNKASEERGDDEEPHFVRAA